MLIQGTANYSIYFFVFAITSVREEEIIASAMNNYFTNISIHLKLKPTKIDPKGNLENKMNTFQNH